MSKSQATSLRNPEHWLRATGGESSLEAYESSRWVPIAGAKPGGESFVPLVLKQFLSPYFPDHFVWSAYRDPERIIWIDFIDLSRENEIVLQWKLEWIRDMGLCIFWPLVKTWDYIILDIVGVFRRKKGKKR